ncbi:hypothetical protein [Ruegeria atlantica]|uniref:hypothetical protein n=1 Tax=Ruegeria atlantica TaxID=81569 RepID=UPI00147A65EB|nr:hypothetical protein [Ruegeria atlantica]
MGVFGVKEEHGNWGAVFPVPSPNANPKNGVSLPLWLSFVAITLVQPAIGLAAECPRIYAVEDYNRTGVAPYGSVCQAFEGLDSSRGVSCYWTFPFRSAEAASYFEDAWAEVVRCREGSSTSDNSPVNHPDSYDLREFNSGNRVYRAAKKDKGNEKRTLVFLSVEYSN